MHVTVARTKIVAWTQHWTQVKRINYRQKMYDWRKKFCIPRLNWLSAKISSGANISFSSINFFLSKLITYVNLDQNSIGPKFRIRIQIQCIWIHWLWVYFPASLPTTSINSFFLIQYRYFIMLFYYYYITCIKKWVPVFFGANSKRVDSW